METAIEQSNKIRITPDTEVAYVNKDMILEKKVHAEDLAKWIYRRIDTFPDLLEACEHGAKSIHHPACSHGKTGDGNTCECHVKKCQLAVANAKVV